MNEYKTELHLLTKTLTEKNDVINELTKKLQETQTIVTDNANGMYLFCF